jgi:hypothetical protein
MKKVGFEALIKKVEVMSLVSGDKSARITLEIDSPSDDLLDSVNRLHRADKMVGVALAETGK